MTARKGEANVGDSNKISSQNNYIQMTGYVRLVSHWPKKERKKNQNENLGLSETLITN